MIAANNFKILYIKKKLLIAHFNKGMGDFLFEK